MDLINQTDLGAFHTTELVLGNGEYTACHKHPIGTEVYIVKSGTGSFTLESNKIIADENSAPITVLPGQKHQIMNIRKTPLHVISIKTGARADAGNDYVDA